MSGMIFMGRIILGRVGLDSFFLAIVAAIWLLRK